MNESSRAVPEQEVIETTATIVDDSNPGVGLNLATSQAQVNEFVHIAGELEKIKRAHDQIIRFILSIAWPGDWVRFRGPNGEGMLSLSGAGSERIASILGVNFRWLNNGRGEKESGTDELGNWYTWTYTCEAVWRNLTRTASGRESTRNKFFGFADGEWKQLYEIPERNIQISAQRSAQKEGVKQLFGIRAISETAAEKLGLDLSVIRGYDFGSQGQKGRAANAAPLQPAKPGELIELDATGIHPSKAPKFAKSKDTPWENIDEKNLLWYQGAAERNLGGTYNNSAVSDLMAIQPALVNAGHAAKYKFVDKHAKPEEKAPAASEPSPAAAPSKPASTGAPPPSAGGTGLKFRTISEPQCKRLFAIASTEGGISADELKRCLGERYPYLVEDGVVNPQKLRPDHYESACNWAKAGCQNGPQSDTNGGGR